MPHSLWPKAGINIWVGVEPGNKLAVAHGVLGMWVVVEGVVGSPLPTIAAPALSALPPPASSPPPRCGPASAMGTAHPREG